jgi:hypothetical protein
MEVSGHLHALRKEPLIPIGQEGGSAPVMMVQEGHIFLIIIKER